VTDETAHALAELNRRFYAERAADFAETRQHPWAGFERCLPFLAPPTAHSAGPAPWRVLDAGCGNGRLGAFLRERADGPLAYLGIDESERLLAGARERLSGWDGARLTRADLLSFALPRAGFDAVVLFGVLHHVPGRERREALMTGLGDALAPGGHLLATIWRADRFERFRDRFVPWQRCRERTGIAVDPDDLEPGDVLLPWKQDPTAVRYCHFPSEAEVAGLVDASGLSVRETFDADGREGELNRYWVLGPR